MAKLKDYIQYSYRSSDGQPIEHNNLIVTPVSRVLSIRMPYWGFVWNRPVAVRVQDGPSTSELAIIDVTLLIQVGLVLLSLAASVIVSVFGRRRQG